MNGTQKANTKQPIKNGDRVRNPYGDVETVFKVEESRVVTYESARRNNWYHPSKVFKVE